MPPPTAATPSAGPAPPPSPGRASVAGSDATPWHQLHEQHMAEQVELLEQQAAEQQALLAAHEDEQALKGHSSSLKHRLQAPFVLLLSCTMPRVGTGSGHRYSRTRACLLPVTMPLLWLAAAPSLLDAIGWPGLAFGGVCGGVGSAILSVTYPASNVPRKELKGERMQMGAGACDARACIGTRHGTRHIITNNALPVRVVCHLLAPHPPTHRHTHRPVCGAGLCAGHRVARPRRERAGAGVRGGGRHL
jgi:hypothetical protein